MNFQLKTEMIRALRVLRKVSILRCFGGSRHAGLALVGAFLLMTWAGQALAQATCTGTAATITVTMPATLAFPRDTVNGGLLTGWMSAGGTNFYSCTTDASSTAGTAMRTVGLVDSGLKVTHTSGVSVTVWNSGVPGIGIAIAGLINNEFGSTFNFNIVHGSISGGTFTFTPDPWIGTSARTGGHPTVSWGGGVQIALVKTGPVAAAGGTIASGIRVEQAAMVNNTVGGAATILAGMRKSYSMTAVTVTPQTCLVTTGSVAVSMGNVRPTSLATVGATSPGTAFNVGVNCSGLASKVYMTLTDQQNPANVTSTLPLTTASTAKGVGIQILFNSNPISFGADSSLAGNTNQFSVFTSDGSAGAGVTNVALTARYIRTGTITPGTANGIATFTMSYQ